ncbi:17256_t:CDS:2, partial [Racocetra fulgida]
MSQDPHNIIFTSYGRNKKRMKSSWSSEDEDTVHQKVEETREEKYERDTQRAFEILKEDISRKPHLLPLRTDHKGNKHVQSFEQLMKHADDYESEFRRLYSETAKPDNPNSNKKFREAVNLTPGTIFCGQVNQKTESLPDRDFGQLAYVVGSNNRMKCTSFNYTGSMFAISGTDGLVRVYSTIGGTALYDNNNKKGKKAKKPFDLVEIIKQSSDPEDSDDSDDDLIGKSTRSSNGQSTTQSTEKVAPLQNRQPISSLSKHYNAIPSTSKQPIVTTVSSPSSNISLESTSQSHSSLNNFQS